MVTGLIGKKVGMTQLFAADGSVQPATVLKAGPCVIAQVKTVETDGYQAVQLGLVEAKPTKENKPSQGHFKKAGVPATRVRRELPLKPAAAGDVAGAAADAAGEAKTGDIVNVSIFADGERVDVIGTSRGKGFQGVMKRHNFGGGAGSHGSMFHRAPGSIGASSYPSRVVKGMRMGGHMGADRVTVRNLKVLRVDTENNLLLLEGAVPGGPNAIVVIRKAIAAKKLKVAQVEPTKKKGKK
jgi:large subunit ribosomal protein L3